MKINKILSSLILAAVLALPVVAMAAPPELPPTGYSWDVIKTFISGTLYTVGGFVIVVMLLVSGIMFVTAGGSPEKVATARNTLMYAVVGGVVLVIAASIWSIIGAWLG